MDAKRKLIGLMKNQRVLYNTNLAEYKDSASRNEAWRQIAEEMGLTVDECKNEWVKIRNSYVNALRRRVNQQTRTGKILPPWIYETELSFIKPFMTGRGWDDTPYTVLLGKTTEDTEDISDHETQPQTKTENESVVIDYEIDENEYESITKIHDPFSESSKTHELYINERKPKSSMVNGMDETDLFFLGLSQTMKKLPNIEQCKLKMDMFKIMNDAEMKHLKNLKRKRKNSSD